MAYMGTFVTAGRGEAVVTETGMRSELGRIATLIQTVDREPTTDRNPRRDSLLNESMVLFEDVIEIGRRPTAATTSECSACFQFRDGAGVGEVAIHIDDSGPDLLAAVQRKLQEMLSRGQVPVRRQHKIDSTSF